MPEWSPLRLSSGAFRRAGLLAEETGKGPDAFFKRYESVTALPFYDDDPASSVAVKDVGGLLSIFNNGKSDGEVPSDNLTMSLCGILPAMFADTNESAFVIGFGTGVTAGELAQLPTMKRVDVAEISSAVIEAAPLFDKGNQGASTNPKVHIVRTDAYRALMRSSELYDVIASEPSNPWVTGVEMLFSREFLMAARQHLKPGGVYAQWFHLYETDVVSVELVLRTYKSVFDDVAVWYAMGNDLLLLGFQKPDQATALDRIEKRFYRPEFSLALNRLGIASFEALLAHERLPAGVVSAVPLPGEVHTLFHPRLSHTAARAFFLGNTADLPHFVTPKPAAVGAETSLLRRYAARFPGQKLPDDALFELMKETFKHHPSWGIAPLVLWELDHSDWERTAEFKLAADGVGVTFEDMQGMKFLLRPDSVPMPRCDTMPRLAELFEVYYHYGVPFDQAALKQASESCGEDPKAAAALRRLL
jgi:SAM-dependent methyltransferase